MDFNLGQTFFPGFGLLLQIFILLSFLAIMYWVIKSGKIANETPKEILQKRLAKGEISKKEFNSLLKELEE